MSANTAISWAHHTFNPWHGCVKVSPACTNCYAERQSNGWPTFNDGARKPLLWGPGSERKFLSDDYWKQPLRWNRKAKERGERQRVFCASMSDVFEVPIFKDGDGRELRERLDRERRRLWTLIEQTPSLDWLLLTKRPQFIMGHVPPWWSGGFPANVFVGTTTETQGWLEDRLLELLGVPAIVRFLSIGPMLGAMNLRRVRHRYELGEVYVDALTGEYSGDVERAHMPTKPRGVQWVIAEGESGPDARPSHPSWFLQLRNQCRAVGTPFHFKQWGEWRPAEAGDDFNTLEGHAGDPPALLMDIDGHVHCTREAAGHDAIAIVRVGVHTAGRLLNGEVFDEFPAVRALTAETV